MRSNKKRIRIDYAPLNVAVSLECLTPLSPALQVFHADNNEYEPDREVTPSTFWPQVVAHANDGSWPNQYANFILTQMHWYVDGIEISQHPDWTGQTSGGQALYTIDESGSSSRGSLTIRKNVPPTKQYTLHFEGVITDPRLGTNIPIVTDDFILSTEDKSEDAYSISIGDDQIIQYNPFKDKLHLYDYKVAHGLIAASAAAEAAATDENAYLRTINIDVFKADTKLNSGFTIKLYRVNSATSFTEISAGTDEVISISNSAIVLDLRLVTKADYLIRAVLTDSSRPDPQLQFSVNRVYQNYDCRPTNGTSILPSDEQRYDVAMCDSEGQLVDCPENILKIIWKTDSAYLANLEHNEGGHTVFSIAKTKIGKNFGDDWLDVYVETEIKEAHCDAIDENGNDFTDENGNDLIFN